MGVILSGVAAYFAKSASTAARQARQAVLSNTLAEEINFAEKLAAEISNLVDLGKHELGRLRCNDLHDRTVTILNRWDGSLPTESKNNCLSAQAQLESLRTVISKLWETMLRPHPGNSRKCRTVAEKLETSSSWSMPLR